MSKSAKVVKGDIIKVWYVDKPNNENRYRYGRVLKADNRSAIIDLGEGFDMPISNSLYRIPKCLSFYIINLIGNTLDSRDLRGFCNADILKEEM